jgi:hypothetical protein
MHATIDCPTYLEGAEFSFDHDWMNDSRLEIGAWDQMNRVEMVRESLRIGIPLHRVEKYLEWRDLCRQC